MTETPYEVLEYIQKHSKDAFARMYARSILRLSLIPEQRNSQLKYLSNIVTDPKTKKILTDFML